MIILKNDFAAKGIIIEPPVLDEKELITYDLETDDSYQDPGIATLRSLSKPHFIPPNSCVLVKTQQVLTVPNNVFGVITCKASLTTIGLIVANIKIDPNFHGQLTVCLFNASNKPIKIQSRMRFCSIFFQQIHPPVASSPLRSPPGMRPSENSRIVEWFYERKEFILAAMAFAGVVISIVALLKGK